MSIDREKLIEALVGGGVPPRVHEAVAERVHTAAEDELAAALGASDDGEPDTSAHDATGYVAIVEAATSCVSERDVPGYVSSAAGAFLVGEFTRWSS